MDPFENLSLMGLVPVLALDDADDAVPLCKALADGGLPVAEITFRTEAAEEAIRRVHQALPNVLLCAGTVLTADQARRAVAAGAAAIVSPGLNPAVVEYCLQNGVPVCPGVATPSEVEKAMTFGLDTVKFFPAEQAGGIGMIRALCGPYHRIRFMPTGGIHENNMLDYLSFEKVLCCGGSWMAPKNAVAKKDWGRVTAITRSAVRKMLGLELRSIGIPAKDRDEARGAALLLSRLMGCEAAEGSAAFSAGETFEVTAGCGTRGQIILAANSLRRARWHLENRGFRFLEGSDANADGGKTPLCLADAIAGFTILIVQKERRGG